MDLYIYVSEQETFGDFNNSEALVWMEEDLWYGDWYGGENEDGCFTSSTTLQTSEVID